MRIKVDNTCVTFVRDNNDPKFYGVQQAKGESNLFHWLKYQIAKGHPDLPSNFPIHWIKKRMWKDGHMKDDMQQYLRTQKPVHKDEYGTKFYLCMYNGMWTIRGAEEDWNEGSMTLTMNLVTICDPELSLADPKAIAAQSKKVWDQTGKELGIRGHAR